MKDKAQPAPGEKQAYYPPTGTYPSPAEAPAHSGIEPPPPAPPVKTRRVGTLTMALCLIAVGVVLLLAVLFPGQSSLFLFIARLSPVVLVLLGIELLIASIRHRQEKLRFDVLSVFICLVLIMGSLGATAVSHYVGRNQQSQQVENRLAAELEQASAQVMQAPGAPNVSNVEWYVGLHNGNYTAGITPAQLRPEHSVQVRVFFSGSFQSAAAFASDCRKTLDMLRPLVPHLDYVSFYSRDDRRDSIDDEEPRFWLWLDGPYQIDDAALDLESLVESDQYNDE